MLKREIKNAITTIPQNATSIFYKSYLEYLRNNYKKAIKLLNVHQNTNNDKLLPVLFYNNMGCIHYRMKKYNAALYYFTRALKESSNNGESVKSVELKISVKDKKSEILYNTGLQLLFTGRYETAFECFQESATVLYQNPKLWLRLAECCIGFQSLKKEEKNELIKEPIGYGLSRKLMIATPENTPLGDNEMKISTDENDGNGKRAASPFTDKLEYAIRCLKNVLLLCIGNEPEITLLRCAALLNLAYINLLQNNPLAALSYINELLAKKDKVLDNQSFLARMYAAEALSILNKSAEASQHLLVILSSENFSNNTNNNTIVKVESNSEYYQPTPSSRAAFYANLATVYILQDDISSAQQYLNHALQLTPRSPFLTLMQIYIELRKNNTEAALELLKKGKAKQPPQQEGLQRGRSFEKKN